MEMLLQLTDCWPGARRYTWALGKSPTFPAQALGAPNEHALFISPFPSSQYIHTEQETTDRAGCSRQKRLYVQIMEVWKHKVYSENKCFSFGCQEQKMQVLKLSVLPLGFVSEGRTQNLIRRQHNERRAKAGDWARLVWRAWLIWARLRFDHGQSSQSSGCQTLGNDCT